MTRTNIRFPWGAACPVDGSRLRYSLDDAREGKGDLFICSQGHVYKIHRITDDQGEKQLSMIPVEEGVRRG